MLRYTFLFFLCFQTIYLKAQNTANNFVYSSPKGNYILLPGSLSDKSVRPRSDISVERSRKGQNKFEKRGSFTPVHSYSEFEKLAGSEVATKFKSEIKAKNNEEVIQLLNTTRDFNRFGFFILNIDFLRAAGLALLDPMPENETVQYEYRLTEGGKTIAHQESVSLQRNNMPKGVAKELFTTDSLVRIKWQIKPQSSLPLFALVYRQENGSGPFRLLPRATTVNNEDGQSVVYFEERKSPEHLANYYLIPVDIFGNEGNPSDTISAITVDFKKIPGIIDLDITDTTDGLFCQWKPLPQKPYYTGIQILRSRDPMKNFIVLDSLPASATSYLDIRVLPGITYYYKFRPLVNKISGWDEIIATTANGTKSGSGNPPLSPQNLEASHEGRNIKLTWDANSELDIFAYYILRGTTENNMEIISSAVRGNMWIDSSQNLSGKLNYLYSVIVVNNRQLKSKPSAPVGIRPDRSSYIEPPAGISINASGKTITLQWPDMRKKDLTIAGYIVYRKRSSENTFTPVIKKLITEPQFEDTSAIANIKYTYAITSVDNAGYESERSPEASFILKDQDSPPLQFYVRKTPAGIEISWPGTDRSDIISYNIYRRLPEEKKYIKAGSVNAGNYIFTDKRFVPGKINVYSITITTIGGESGQSIEKTIFAGK